MQPDGNVGEMTGVTDLIGDFERDRATIAEALRPRCAKVLARFPIEGYIGLLDAIPAEAHYFRMSDAVSALWDQILSSDGPEALEAYNRMTMLHLIDGFDQRAVRHDYPASIRAEYGVHLDRIIETIRSAAFGTYVHTDDIFLKDLALCRQTIFPTRGAQIVEHVSGILRSLALKGGVSQLLRYGFMDLFVTRGSKPVYRTHLHLARVEDFTPEGRDQCFMQIAEMLERHPEVKGWFAGGWLYDRALGDVSPHLADIHRRPASNGGWAFHFGDDLTGNALVKSRTRQRLYEEGRYRPKAWYFVWPRKKLLAWARGRSIGPSMASKNNR